MQTINDDNRGQSTGVTRMRCQTCKKFARLLPGETKCGPCMGMLPLALTLPTAAVRGGR
ncbi:hypothetical protein SAMN04489732_115126 [Amycolatopsis saalfeldensis]|uniref:Uncharacterized protein n=1 Tax=Amycolatopsis saalfeldensis TaxID=394193 RepID=A0A1H8YHY0_9PSEU|nr:hypothetical protein SAMN04489732_115126 [Amycolatopsis saalfeldensis]